MNWGTSDVVVIIGPSSGMLLVCTVWIDLEDPVEFRDLWVSSAIPSGMVTTRSKVLELREIADDTEEEEASVEAVRDVFC